MNQLQKDGAETEKLGESLALFTRGVPDCPVDANSDGKKKKKGGPTQITNAPINTSVSLQENSFQRVSG